MITFWLEAILVIVLQKAVEMGRAGFAFEKQNTGFNGHIPVQKVDLVSRS